MSTPAAPADAPVETHRVATIDIGTNTIRLLIAEAHADGSYQLIDDERVVSRLGKGTSVDRALDPVVMTNAAEAVAHMTEIARGYRVEHLRAVATCAVREAPNQADFLNLVREQAGIDVEVISGTEEARLGWISVRNAFDIRQRDVAVVDIGGGSTEVVVSAGDLIEDLTSLSLGAVRLTEEFPDGDPRDGARRVARMRRSVRNRLRRHLRKPATRPQCVIGIGGTFTSLAAMDRLRAHDGPDAPASLDNIRGYEMTRAEVRRWAENLATMSLDDRVALPGLSEDRASIIVAGLCIAESVMRFLGTSRLQVHDRGIRDGLLISMTRELFPRAAQRGHDPSDRLGVARRFARRCRYEQVHSEHVTTLALRIFDQMREHGYLDGIDRDLLEAAGVLHDIGYYINYAKHHKHSHHLIVHADLRGFSHREIEIIALVARYHRRAHPRKKHPEFAALDAHDRKLVRELAAILRVADGLDRSHACTVRDVTLELGDDTARFVLDADRRPDVDIWGAERKSRLFGRAFGLEPTFQWRNVEAAAPSGASR